MYPVSEAFLTAVKANTRKYYWTGRITTTAGTVYDFDQDDVVKGSGYITSQCWGWCLERKDYRLFKLNRMDRVAETDKEFACRKAPMPDLSNEKIFPGGIKVKALFTPDMKWRLVEEFGPHCCTEADDGRLLFTADYTDMENLVTWLITFGAKAEVFLTMRTESINRV